MAQNWEAHFSKGLLSARPSANTLPKGAIYYATDEAKFYVGSGVANTWADFTAALAPLASPTFTGTPAAPTASPGTNTTQIATTAFTTAAVAAAVAGLSWKQSVRVATAAAGTLATSFENGDTVDGVTLATGDRILIKDQASGSENGIYTVNASGAPTRATDADTAAEILQASVYVQEGTANADTQWVCTTNAPITLNTTALVFAQLSSGGANALDDLSDVDTTGAVTGDVLTFDGADWVPEAPTGGAGAGALVLLESHTASASATLDFTTRNAAGQSGATIQADYDHYVIVIHRIVPATTNVDLLFRVSNDGGSSFISSGYFYAGHHWTSAANFQNGATGQAQMPLSGSGTGIKNDSGWGVCGRLELMAAGTSQHSRLFGQINFVRDSDSIMQGVNHSGLAVSTSPGIDAFRFYFSSGNIASGTIRIYGVSK
jgi:hypothetical protein